MYDCIIVGGGIAGLQASIQLGRYRRKVLLIDRGDGRSALCRSYHNVLGYPEGVSGQTLRELGRKQAASYGVQIIQGDAAKAAKRQDSGFTITCRVDASTQKTFQGRTVLLATGVMDRVPILEGLRPALGLTVFVCPDCDGFESEGKRTVVLGSGNTGAHMALTLMYFCNELFYVNHENQPVDEQLQTKLRQANIPIHKGPIETVLLDGAEEEGRFAGVALASGETIRGECGFIAFGGNEVRSDLAKQLDVERLENRHIVTDPRSKMTNVPGVWAAGDVAVHSEQLTIAMGEGQQAAIWMHKWLLAREKEAATRDTHSMETAGAT
jgi:thioredoxin reductase (NADPH)